MDIQNINSANKQLPMFPEEPVQLLTRHAAGPPSPKHLRRFARLSSDSSPCPNELRPDLGHPPNKGRYMADSSTSSRKGDLPSPSGRQLRRETRVLDENVPSHDYCANATTTHPATQSYGPIHSLIVEDGQYGQHGTSRSPFAAKHPTRMPPALLYDERPRMDPCSKRPFSGGEPTDRSPLLERVPNVVSHQQRPWMDSDETTPSMHDSIHDAMPVSPTDSNPASPPMNVSYTLPPQEFISFLGNNGTHLDTISERSHLSTPAPTPTPVPTPTPSFTFGDDPTQEQSTSYSGNLNEEHRKSGSGGPIQERNMSNFGDPSQGQSTSSSGDSNEEHSPSIYPPTPDCTPSSSVTDACERWSGVGPPVRPSCQNCRYDDKWNWWHVIRRKGDYARKGDWCWRCFFRHVGYFYGGFPRPDKRPQWQPDNIIM
ncbi:uncharacterized protein BCR38DRAFT_485389 [Pseudomassariella vexata]|uniref:Uncharacterized protein n=1 Tax=Pseudomassariella vexata TaxID=1141098 RepID=A0A1Y2DYA3_9PEZI|nr:uncharacterized protein BCR38DRAFT_485389 [Pseudomassariella vexata]ORY64251.1 hypothetical protein BCR38DRAFT_485389 [Pseudomassariella vexata]